MADAFDLVVIGSGPVRVTGPDSSAVAVQPAQVAPSSVRVTSGYGWSRASRVSAM